MALRLEAALTGTLGAELSIGRTLNRYPNPTDLMRTLRAHAPDVVFLSFESLTKAQEVVKFLEAEADGMQIIAVHQTVDAKLLRETMRMGIREFVSEPFEPETLLESLRQVKDLLTRKPPSLGSTGQVFAFLPSKAGVGTSTIALNVASALARRPNTHVLLSDFDLNSGMMRFMLKLQNEYSVLDALEHSVHVDEHLWPQLVTTLDNLDVLHAGRVNPNVRIEGPQIRGLIEFMRRNYQALCFDLSGNLERYSLEIMQDCKRVLLVCTPEIPSLHLAREKLSFLRALDLESRVSVILNRCMKKAIFSTEQVEEILGVVVSKTFPNDYNGVNRAMTAGTYMDLNTEMGKSFTQYAQELVEGRPGPPEAKKRFIEQIHEQIHLPTPRALISVK